ncbi:MAG: DUF1385 domain-containing protein [Lachnospiraceae bacterium]|nr:DUF1385 domain-containing protein [Lachnospiraceae bacterium]
MRYSGIGGQAVIEGVMMRNGDDYAVAVRKPDHEIAIRKQKVSGPGTDHWSRKIPIVRGVLSFADSLVLGMGALSVSSEYFDEEDEDEKKSVEEDDSAKSEKKQKKEKLENTLILVSSFVLAIVVFMIIPYLLSLLFKRFGLGDMLITLIEGVIRVVIFLAYMFFISFLEDIKRTYMYHGAEHKCINCIESGLELNVENVRKSSRFHKRCGTSFLFVVVIVSIVVFMFIRVDSRILRLALRLLLIPVVAGISYEFIRLAGRYDNPVINFLSKPGLWLQKLSTAEPDDDMIEVGIASVEAVFDWKDFISKSENSNGDNSK